MTERTSTRRERYREQTLAEIKTIALAQIASGGVEALSLNAIAKDMAVSGAALYRYFASRDELLADLVVEAYDDLALALEEAASVRHRSPAAPLRAVAAAYRDWALAQPHRYRLVFSTPMGSGQLAAGRVIPAAQRSMNVFLDVLSALPEADLAEGARAVPAPLASQLRSWGQRSGGHHDTALLRLGLACWTRLHGSLDLELGGHLHATQVDAALLYELEVEDIVRAR